MFGAIAGLDAREGGSGVARAVDEKVGQGQGRQRSESKDEERPEVALFVVGVFGAHSGRSSSRQASGSERRVCRDSNGGVSSAPEGGGRRLEGGGRAVRERKKGIRSRERTHPKTASARPHRHREPNRTCTGWESLDGQGGMECRGGRLCWGERERPSPIGRDGETWGARTTARVYIETRFIQGTYLSPHQWTTKVVPSPCPNALHLPKHHSI
ncbi:hypothetical protein VTK73DRAFT_6521 [Phialemonium thermophilum]|uniref:Uncharacterized protein n=1 Tax=Phialemonium thermophilum TaxID=223376 RepID=A0ABR3UZL0_9PEZI